MRKYVQEEYAGQVMLMRWGRLGRKVFSIGFDRRTGNQTIKLQAHRDLNVRIGVEGISTIDRSTSFTLS